MLVEQQALVVDVAVEVDRQLRYPRHRFVDVDEGDRAVAADDPAGDPQVAVEPAVQQHPAVDLDAERAPGGRDLIGVRVDPQPGGVGVRADDPQR